MKKRRTRTRRRKALRWAVLLAVLFLVSNGLGIISLLPGQALRRVWQREGIQQAEIVHAEWGTTTPMQPKRIYLCEFGDSILMASVNWNFFMAGWYPSGDGLILDKTDPEKYHTCWMSAREDEILGCAVGFVPEGGEAPMLLLRFNDWVIDENGDGEYVYVGDPIVLETEANIPVEGGMCYLTQFRMHDMENRNGYTFPEVTVCEAGETFAP